MNLSASYPAVGAPTFPELGVVKRGGGFQMKGYWIWDASVIRDAHGLYHLIASRWPQDISFHPGWMTDSEVVHAVSASPEGPYSFASVLLPARGPEYWDGRSTHNPILCRHQGRYLIFYLGSTHPLGPSPRGVPFELDDPRCLVARSQKRIGLAVATHLEGPWQRFDQPILDTQPGTFYSFLTSNPAPVVHPDGSVLLVFKSRRYLANGLHSPLMLGVARAKHYLGPYEVVSKSPLFGRDFGEVEDPFIWQNEQGHYEMVAKDMTGEIVGERHAGLHAWSQNGENWQPGARRKAWTRTLRFDDGTTETLGQLERPFVFCEAGLPLYLFAAIGDGAGGFENMTRTQNICIPLIGGARCH